MGVQDKNKIFLNTKNIIYTYTKSFNLSKVDDCHHLWRSKSIRSHKTPIHPSVIISQKKGRPQCWQE